MAFQPSPWVEINGGNPAHGERSKRLCTGLGNETRPTIQSQQAGSQALPDYSPYDVPGYNSDIFDIQEWSGSAVEFNDVSLQHVGSVQGQTSFPGHQNLPWPSLSSWLEVADTTPSAYHQVSNDQARIHPTSNTYHAQNPPNSAINSQPTPTSNLSHAENPYEQYHPPDFRTVSENACQNSVSDDTSDPKKSVDTGHIDTSYELCLGLINTATLRVSSATLETIPAGHSVVKLDIQGPVTTVHSVYKTSNGEYMGLLDHETARALGQIRQEHDVYIRAYIFHDRESGSKNSGVTWGASIPIYIVVYSHPEDPELVGQKLSESNIFLQHPQYKEDLALYKNPQYLIRPGEEHPSIDCIDADPSSSCTEPSNERGTLNENRLDSIFESAQGPETYSTVESSPRLCTILQPHQRMGLAMMHEKESGNIQKNEFTALWSQTSTSNGRSWYRNSVTGSVKENPILCLGGLLADEMGLGKSLTVIALIAGTLDAHLTEESPHGPSSQSEKCIRTTLIVTPKSTLHSWKEQFAKHTKSGSVQIRYYSGNKRKPTEPALNGYDVIVTTYGTLTAERNRRAKQSCDEDQPLLANHWLRVVLDEAHVIRNASTKQCATVCALKAQHRWCLTGTPIQNQIEDFGSLLQFLQVYPFDNPSSFTHEIADWIRCGDEKGMKRLRLLVSAICLRRTKDCLGLPPRKNEIQSVVFNNEEKQLYEICKQSTVEFIELVFKEDGKLKSFAVVIQLILRLRQICNHGKEMLSAKTLKNIDDYTSSQGSRGSMSPLVEIALCGICGRKVQHMDSLLPCMHPACSSCYEEKEIMVSKGELECSICAGTGTPRSNSNPGTDRDQPMPGAMIVDYRPSSKVAALIKNLQSYNEDSTNLPIKSVVFSYWTKMLDLISQALNASDIKFERLDGKMSTPQRHKAIQKFRNDVKCTVFLATVGSAGVGIDLTAACRVHLMEPQWNPMAEEQALDRVHRIGQTQPVIATRYVVSESVEEYVVSLQKKKLDLIQQSLGPNAAPKTSALKDRLKTLHDFLNSSATTAGDQ